MNEKLKKVLENMHRYNAPNIAFHNYGLDAKIVYDALVLAPGWKPTKIIKDPTFKITVLAEHSYISGYLIEKDGLKIAWVQIASGACNTLDHLLICGELQFRKLIFIGAVGSLKEAFQVGDLCTPSYCIAGTFANAYLNEKLNDYQPFEKVYPSDPHYIEKTLTLIRSSGYEIKSSSVYCTDSISMEYSHLPEIKAYDTDLIDMETSTFYAVSALFDVPSIALLIVSDNSTCGHPLVGRNEELEKKYNDGRKVIIPDLIYQIAKQR